MTAHEHGHPHGHPHGHGHDHGHDHGVSGRDTHRALMRALIVTLVIAVAEIVGGFVTNSLALIADAGHMVTDVGALGLALFAAWLQSRPPAPGQTFGRRRWEVLAAWINGAALVAISGGLLWESVGRLRHPPDVQGGLMLVIATVGLASNAISAWWLHGAANHSLNARGAYLHVLGDLAGSLATIIAAALLMQFGWRIADPIASIVVSVLVFASALRLIRESTDVLLEATPAHIDLPNVRATLEQVPSVQSVHDLHVWTVGSGMIAMSAHAVVTSEDSRQQVLEASRHAMEDLGIGHVTIQIEGPALDGCGDCEPGKNEERGATSGIEVEGKG